MGGPYWDKNLDSLATDGRLVLLGTLGGPESENKANTGIILRKRATVVGTTLRNRSNEYKGVCVCVCARACGRVCMRVLYELFALPVPPPHSLLSPSAQVRTRTNAQKRTK